VSGYLLPPTPETRSSTERVAKTPVAKGPEVPRKASVRMAETTGLSVSDADGRAMVRSADLKHGATF